MKSLLHAAFVVLTVLLFLMKPSGTLAAVCYKRINPGLKYYPGNLVKEATLSMDDVCTAKVINMPPKYKRDPEIDVDNELIGNHPLV
ncbi:unnamed protein product [Euphydryas editha]|uniref:Uncharacterized protein n=1 Tax=Euphydryas editha TaxID=104508 RepID=A0AAU9UB12_EUPED|nr:unnamed protein product [Euphydryas editha]